MKKRLQLFSELQEELQKERERASTFLPNILQTSASREGLLTQTSRSMNKSNVRLLPLSTSNSGAKLPERVHTEGDQPHQSVKTFSNPATTRGVISNSGIRKLNKFITQPETIDRAADRTKSDAKQGQSYKSVLDSIYQQLARVDHLNAKIKKAQERVGELDFDSESSIDFNSPHNSVKSHQGNDFEPDLFFALKQLNEDPINYDEVYTKPIPLHIQMSPRNIIGKPSPGYFEAKAREEQALLQEQAHAEELKHLKIIRDKHPHKEGGKSHRARKEGGGVIESEHREHIAEDHYAEEQENNSNDQGDHYRHENGLDDHELDKHESETAQENKVDEATDNDKDRRRRAHLKKKRTINPNIGAKTGYFSNISTSVKDPKKKRLEMAQEEKTVEPTIAIFKNLTKAAEDSEKRYQQDLKKHLNQIAKQSAVLLTMNKITRAESKVKQHIAELSKKMEPNTIEEEEQKEVDDEMNKWKNPLEDPPQIFVKDSDRAILLAPEDKGVKSKNPKSQLQEDVMKRYLPTNVANTFSKGFKKTL